MQIVYSKPKDMQTLALQLMAYSDMTEEAALRSASEAIHGTTSFPIPLQPREDWPHVPEREMRVIHYRIHRIITAIAESYPLLRGEEMEKDGYFATYLSKDYLHFPVGTVAVRRTTSFGELVFFDNSFVFKDKSITGHHRPIVPDLDSNPNLKVGAAIKWGDLAIDIAKSLASSIAGKAGAAIFDKLFPAGVPSYFDEVYTQFERIINKAIAENKRKEISASVSAVQDGMRTYNIIKKDPAKYEQSQQMLSDLWNESRNLVSTIMVFNEVGLGLFSVAGGLHLAILQERAFTDRDHEDPNDSPWAIELLAKANAFAPWAIAEHNKTIKTRGDAITEVKFVQRSVFVPGAGMVDESYYVWEDKIAGDRYTYNKRQGCCDPDPVATSHADRQRRWNDTVVVMTENLKPLIIAAEDWKTMTTMPLIR
jgi:hypothetical protein